MVGSGSVPLIPDLQILDPKVEDLRFHSFSDQPPILGWPSCQHIQLRILKFLKKCELLGYYLAKKYARQAPQVEK